MKQENIGKASSKLAGRDLNVIPDAPDLRDRMYEPALIDVKVKLDPPPGIVVRDQGEQGACTGFGLAAVIDHLNDVRRAAGAEDLPAFVSSRMLYEMAKLHDEWTGTDYDGSSIRGALKGFFNNGVCSEDSARYVDGQSNWQLSIAQAKEARSIGLGAYYRLRPNLIDYHVALNEVGAIYCSARVHSGWRNPPDGKIGKSETHFGGHAFAIVGYDRDGFIIQNSWGKAWGGFKGQSGIAHWTYQDWAANVMDAWVLRLSVPAPDAFDIISSPMSNFGIAEQQKSPRPRRGEIVGHFANIDDAELVETGVYASPSDSLIETVGYLAGSASLPNRKYDHILFYAHGGLNGLDDSARRIHAMKTIYKRNRIYPFHFMWGTGFTDEFIDALTGAFGRSMKRVGGLSDRLDSMLEKISRPIGRAVWRQMKDDARRSFLPEGGGFEVMQMFLDMNAALDRPYKIHLVGHSAGAILHGYLLDAIPMMGVSGKPVESLSLMAPACSVDLYDNFYKSRIGKNAVDGVKKATVFRLTDKREQDDNVGKIYRKSLLYLVSNAFEDRDGMPLLGMEEFAGQVVVPAGLEQIYAGRQSNLSDSKSHGGFDNDRATMNHILKTILGSSWNPQLGFQEHELAGF